MKRFVRSALPLVLALSACIPAVAAPTFQEKVTYIPSLTSAERTKIHGYVEALSGDVGDAIAGDGSYNPLTLVGAMLDGGSYDSISRGAGGQAVSTAYPFPVNNNANNQNERDRKQTIQPRRGYRRGYLESRRPDAEGYCLRQHPPDRLKGDIHA